MLPVLQKLRAWFSAPPVDGRDTLASLLLAGREDPAFRDQLVCVLRLPRAQREPLIATALAEMALRGEPAAARDAFRLLATEEGARQALQALDAW